MEPASHMTKATIIDGKAIAKQLHAEIADEVAKMEKKPGLAVILVGSDAASEVYVRNKIRACKKAGIQSFESHLPEKATQEEVAAEIKAFNDNPDIDGILMQLPVPRHLDSNTLIQMIDPAKDVDGLTCQNLGALITGTDGLVPCTPQGTLMLAHSVMKDLSGLHAVVIGRSLLFGKPMTQLLLSEDCTVTQAHSQTREIEHICKEADILIAAVGQPKMVKPDWIKPGAIVLDVGINRLEDGSLCGDVDYEGALNIAEAITPVPGGVGPMTIACLLKNTVKAAKTRQA